MKKLALILLGVLIGVIASHLFKPETTNEVVTPVVPEKNMEEQDNLFTMEVPEKWPIDTISVKDAEKFCNLYKNPGKLGDLEGKPNNRSVWFSTDTLLEYIVYAQEQSKKADNNMGPMTGLRIYFAAYPENYKDKEKAGYNTVFLAPTYHASESKSSVISTNAILKEADILGTPPLNEGSIGNPPGAVYPNN
ncbi:hypothetical protein [Formosa sp. S-31]|uniref:hypothetical protein n=1 Tax=Formosa sp. S-31 TaxID=2790949 RepID=UPI003EC0646E